MWKKSTIKYNITPQIRVTSRENGWNQIFVFPVKSKSFDEIYLKNDIRSSHPLNAELSQEPARIQKRNFFDYLPSTATKHEIDPFVVEVSKAEYFENINEVLKKYADGLASAITLQSN